MDVLLLLFIISGLLYLVVIQLFNFGWISLKPHDPATTQDFLKGAQKYDAPYAESGLQDQFFPDADIPSRCFSDSTIPSRCFSDSTDHPLLISDTGKGSVLLTEYGRPEVFVTVICAVRNESENISNILNDLVNQNYPANLLEIIIVDDHSDDNTYQVTEEWEKKYSKVSLLSSHGEGKKEAIQHGVRHARGELILFTDGDCRTGENWIRAFVSHYLNHHASLMAGPVILTVDKNTTNLQEVFYGLQALEFASLIASGAGSMSIGRPVMMNGANMGVSRKAMTAVNDLKADRSPSGDDMFLLQSIKRMPRHKIHFIKAREALVNTKPAFTLKQFLSQRIRWSSKGRLYRDPDIIITGAVVLFFNMALVGILIAAIFQPVYLFYYILGLLFKFTVDFPLLYFYSDFYDMKANLKYLPMLIPFYPLYVVMVFLLGGIIPFSWKGRWYSGQKTNKKAFG